MTTPEAAALTEQIADVLYEHMARTEKTGYIHGCKCGWSARPDKSYRAHVAAEIAARLADSRTVVTTEAAQLKQIVELQDQNAELRKAQATHAAQMEAKDTQLADAWDKGYAEGVIGAKVSFEASKPNPYRLSPTGDDSSES